MMNKTIKNYLQKLFPSLRVLTLLICLPVLKMQAQASTTGLKVTAGDSTLSIKWYGQGRLDAIGDLNRTDATIDFVPYKIPVTTDGITKNQGQRTTFNAVTARIGVDAGIPLKFQEEPINIKVEGDFSGRAANASAPLFRLRKAYTNFRKFIIGLHPSSFSDFDVSPKTLDLAGPSGFVGSYRTQVAWTDDVNDKFNYTISIEDAPLAEAYEANNLVQRKSIPAFAANIKWKGEFGHIQLAGLLRTIEYHNREEKRNFNVTGGGGLLSSAINIAPKRTALKLQAVYGTGIGSYIGGLYDMDGETSRAITTTIQRPELDKADITAINAGGGTVGIDHYWMPEKLRSTFSYSMIQAEKMDREPDEFKTSHYVSANVVWELTKQISFGGEYLWGKRINVNDRSGEAHRVQATALFAF
ncbi:MAG: DcaP family trimeric outer membrane transporter [Cytophagales bacterium]|nr:DcaP family trimeric outer membrane transporter [Cytophagales bacterium]